MSYVCIATVTERSHSASGNDTCNWCTARAPERSSGCTRVMVHHRTKPKNRQISMMPILFSAFVSSQPATTGPRAARFRQAGLYPGAPGRRASPCATCVFGDKTGVLAEFLASFCLQKIRGYTGKMREPGMGGDPEWCIVWGVEGHIGVACGVWCVRCVVRCGVVACALDWWCW